MWNAESGGSREYVLHADMHAAKGRGTFGVSVQLKSIAKHRIWGLGKRVSCAKTDGLICTMCRPYDICLHKELPFWGHSDCTCIKFFSGVIFLVMEYEVEGSRPRGRPKRTWRQVVQKDCQARNLNREDAMDCSRWKKLIKIG